MTSEPASASFQRSEPFGGGQTQAAAAESPLTHTGLDIAGQMKSVTRAETDLARIVGDTSATVENTLCVIEIIEETLQQKRRQIAEIQARQEALALEYRQLGRSLDAATKDLAQQFSDIIKDLESDGAITGASGKAHQVSSVPSDLPSDVPSDVASDVASDAASDAGSAAPPETPDEAPAGKAPDAPGASEMIASAMTKTAAQSEAAAGLDLETSDLPPVPEFLGDRNDASDKRDEEPRDSGSSSRGWWKQSKKG